VDLHVLRLVEEQGADDEAQHRDDDGIPEAVVDVPLSPPSRWPARGACRRTSRCRCGTATTSRCSGSSRGTAPPGTLRWGRTPSVAGGMHGCRDCTHVGLSARRSCPKGGMSVVEAHGCGVAGLQIKTQHVSCPFRSAGPDWQYSITRPKRSGDRSGREATTFYSARTSRRQPVGPPPGQRLLRSGVDLPKLEAITRPFSALLLEYCQSGPADRKGS